MRTWDCCMRECRWACFITSAVAGVADLLECMHALLRAGCPAGRAVSARARVRRIAQCITRVSQRIYRERGTEWFRPHSNRLAYCPDDERKSAGTAQAGHRASRRIRVCSHDAPRIYWTRILSALAARVLAMLLKHRFQPSIKIQGSGWASPVRHAGLGWSQGAYRRP